MHQNECFQVQIDGKNKEIQKFIEAVRQQQIR